MWLILRENVKGKLNIGRLIWSKYYNVEQFQNKIWYLFLDYQDYNSFITLDPLNPGGLAYNGKDAKSFPQFFPSCLKSWINFFLQFQQMSQNRNLVCKN